VTEWEVKEGFPGEQSKATSCPAPTKPLVELLDLAGEPQLCEVPGVDQHVAVGHLDGVRPRVGVRHTDEAGVAGRLGGIVRHGVHPAGREDTAGDPCPARGRSHTSQPRPPGPRPPQTQTVCPAFSMGHRRSES